MASIFRNNKIKQPEYADNGGNRAVITDPQPKVSTQGVGQAAPGVVKPGVGGANLPGAPGTHYEYTDTGTGNSGTNNIGDYRVIQNATPATTPSGVNNNNGGSTYPYGIGGGTTEAASPELETLLGAIGYTAPGASGGAAVDPRIAQYQSQLQGYLDAYNQPVSYEKTWGDLAYEDLIRQALGVVAGVAFCMTR